MKRIFVFKVFCVACQKAHELTFETQESATTKWSEFWASGMSIEPQIRTYWVPDGASCPGGAS